MESGNSGKTRRLRCTFSPEFKAEAIKLVSKPGLKVAAVARNLDLTDSALRSSVRQAKIDDPSVLVRGHLER
jgi:transposase